jgi:hypothetical protein
MKRELHVRFCEGLGVQLPWATHLSGNETPKRLFGVEKRPLLIFRSRRQQLPLTQAVQVSGLRTLKGGFPAQGS